MSDKKPMGRDECFAHVESMVGDSVADEFPGGAPRRWTESDRESVACVLAELEDTADKLSDCWLFLDALARASKTPVSMAAAKLLRKHKTPGWKDEKGPTPDEVFAKAAMRSLCPNCGKPLKLTEKCPCGN